MHEHRYKQEHLDSLLVILGSVWFWREGCFGVIGIVLVSQLMTAWLVFDLGRTSNEMMKYGLVVLEGKPRGLG